MIPDRVKVDPMKELLQRFHGAKFITTIDLSSAFLQIQLHRSSRKWTSFQFGNIDGGGQDMEWVTLVRRNELLLYLSKLRYGYTR